MPDRTFSKPVRPCTAKCFFDVQSRSRTQNTQKTRGEESNTPKHRTRSQRVSFLQQRTFLWVGNSFAAFRRGSRRQSDLHVWSQAPLALSVRRSKTSNRRKAASRPPEAGEASIPSQDGSKQQEHTTGERPNAAYMVRPFRGLVSPVATVSVSPTYSIS